MNIPAVSEWLDEQGFGEVVTSRGVGGGCINNGARLQTSSGTSFFLKTNSNSPRDMFAREVDGLRALSVPDGPLVPEPYLHGDDFLLMEDLAPGKKRKDYWQKFGQQMAALHNHTNDQFGFDADNYIGSTPQPNPWTADGFEFFAKHRLGFQAELAARRGLLTGSEARQVDQLASRLPDLVPEQPASLSHGDLWSGNATSDQHGQPAIIDPAAYYGWAEADLAMTALFGGFPGEFYSAYNEVRPLPEGWRERFELYNLYHLLNHLNLFGRGYYGQVIQIVGRFG
ncbi:MAG: fructosamine kinase family protein [Chloroflexota bacterium]